MKDILNEVVDINGSKVSVENVEVKTVYEFTKIFLTFHFLLLNSIYL